MDADLLIRVLLRRARYRRRDHWSPARLAAHQARSLSELRRVAYARSPFYARHHAGLFDAPLSALPPLTKANLMDHFNDVLTAPGLVLADVEEHLRALVQSGGDPGRAWRGRWWVAATAGTTGRRGVFIWDQDEWSTILASYARANDWAGVRAGVGHPLRVAVVSSRNPTHQSAVVGASLASPLVPTLRLDATASLDETISALNKFRPRILVGYASALGPLANAQREGRLQIAPESVFSASEVLGETAAREVTEAWGSAPIDVYAATETAGIASPCGFGNRHVYEDLVIIEPVDEAGSPVPAGTPGARLWVTVLFARTLPLIRYELSDQVVLGGRGCACGRPFRLLAGVEGRSEDVLVLPAVNGEVHVHPNVFHAVLDDIGAAQWQVIHEPGRLRVLLVESRTAIDNATVRQSIEEAVAAAGATRTDVRVETVNNIPRTALGKLPLIRLATA